MGLWNNFIMPCIFRLQTALNTLDLSLYSDSWHFNYSTFLKIFLGGMIAFNALLWGVTEGKKRGGK